MFWARSDLTARSSLCNFTASISTGGPEPIVEDFKSLQSVFTNMVQGILLEDDTVDNLVTIAGEELDDAL